MLTPPRHLILLSHLSGVRVALHSIYNCFLVYQYVWHIVNFSILYFTQTNWMNMVCGFFFVPLKIFQSYWDCGWRVANWTLCFVLTAFSCEVSLSINAYRDTGPQFLKSYPKVPWLSLLLAWWWSNHWMFDVVSIRTHDPPLMRRVLYWLCHHCG
jgi:hypothetical protein